MNTPSLRIVGYIRVSTAQQAEDGVSLDAQRAKLTAYAAAMDLELVGIEVDEGLSAKTLDRPGLRRALAALDAGTAQGLLVTKLDRLTRSVWDLGPLLEGPFAPGKAVLLSVGDSIDTRTAGGRLVLNVLTSVAQWEREAGSERTRDALAQVRAEGGSFGKAPYGTRYGAPGADGRRPLEQDPDEQDVIAQVRSLRAQGLTTAAIVEALRVRGYRARSGNVLGMTQVARIFAARTART